MPQEVKEMRKIPKQSLILPYLIPHKIPGFTQHDKPYVANVLTYRKQDSEKWFFEFVSKVENRIGKEFYPVMRMSDGEYNFLLGEKFPYFSGHSILDFLKISVRYLNKKIFNKNKFSAATAPGISSGDYTRGEISSLKEKIGLQINHIAKKGVLALHLTYPLKPFQEHYHKPLNQWFKQNNIVLDENNYVPFYFVYALFRGEEKPRILDGRTVLIFHSAQGEKRKKIIKELKNEGVERVIWHEISRNRSLFEKIELKPIYFDADIALIGAGVGKFNILVQLETLKIPCIDIGFIFEVWADKKKKKDRVFMIPDSEMDN